MQLEAELVGSSPGQDTALAIGVFDGVHLGHRYLLSQLTEVATENGLLSGVVTFRQHPREIVAPGTTLPYLTTVEERGCLLRQAGIDLVVPLSFTTMTAQLTAREFVSQLHVHLRMRSLVIGPDFALGKDREGTATVLNELGKEIGFTVTSVSSKTNGNDIISSTAIRNAMAEGDMARVTRLLGRDYSLGGEVIRGAGRGANIGFPTANLAVDPGRALPPEGVYATWAHVDGLTYPSMTNIGRNPTFGDNERTVEAFLLDFDGDLYGRWMEIHIVARLRDEKKFDSVEQLKAQIAADVATGKAILEARRNG